MGLGGLDLFTVQVLRLRILGGIFIPEGLVHHLSNPICILSRSLYHLLTYKRRTTSPLRFALSAGALAAKIHCSKFQQFRIIFEVAEPKIAMLTKRASNEPCFVIMVDNNISHKTTNNAFTYSPCLISTRVFRLRQTRRNPKLFSILITAITAPTIQTIPFFIVQRKKLRSFRLFVMATSAFQHFTFHFFKAKLIRLLGS